jgi:hypothetical protein
MICNGLSGMNKSSISLSTSECEEYLSGPLQRVWRYQTVREPSSGDVLPPEQLGKHILSSNN